MPLEQHERVPGVEHPTLEILGLFSFAQTFVAQFCEAWVVEVWKIYWTIG
jgi:hypothetical protein